MRTTYLQRFLASVSERDADACWPWPGSTFASGYGQASHDGRNRRAHRVVYEQLIGPIPEGLELDHLCHPSTCRLGSLCPHRRCCNPAHLKPSTPDDNYHRTGHTTKTHCPQGHPYDAANTYPVPGTVRSRGCRACRSASSRRHYDRQRVSA